MNQYQDAKDINRDELVVNGIAISGAKGGYTAAVDAIRDGLNSAASDAGGKALSPKAQESAAQLLLSILNRTSSGFIAFEEVLRLFDCPDVTIVAPESAAAKPLEALVLGGIALGRAHTRYSVRCSDGAGRPLAVVDATFSFRVSVEMLSQLVEGEHDRSSCPAEELQASVSLQWA